MRGAEPPADRGRLLPPEAVARLAGLDLIARHVVEGHFAGLHRSPYHGYSAEFSQHRPYSPGDDLRRIDWGVWGRSGRLYLKQFDEETNLSATILLDVSRSMAYPPPDRPPREGLNKSFYSRSLAACLTHLLLRQRDAVGLMLFAERVVEVVPPSSRPSHRRRLLAMLERARPRQARTDLGAAMHQAAESLRRRGLIVLLSDLQDCDPAAVGDGLRHLRHRGHGVLALRVLHPTEIELRLAADVVLRDLETGKTLATHGIEARRSIAELQARRARRWTQLFGAAGADFATIRSDQALAPALGAVLRRRARAGRRAAAGGGA